MRTGGSSAPASSGGSPARLVLRAIGYKARPLPGVPFDEGAMSSRTCWGGSPTPALGSCSRGSTWSAGSNGGRRASSVRTSRTPGPETVAGLLADLAAPPVPLEPVAALWRVGAAADVVRGLGPHRCRRECARGELRTGPYEDRVVVRPVGDRQERAADGIGPAGPGSDLWMSRCRTCAPDVGQFRASSALVRGQLSFSSFLCGTA